MEEKKQIKLVKEKRKWFQIMSPKIFGGRVIGETLGETIDNLKGRKIEVSAGVVTGDMKKQFVSLIFKVIGGDNNGANTDIEGLIVSQSYLKRGMRRFRGKLENSFMVKSVEGNVRIKVLLLLRNKIHRSIGSKLLKTVVEISNKFVEGKKFEDLINTILNDSFNRAIKDGLKKTYPVADVEIRYFCKD